MQFQPDIIIFVGINDLRWIEIELLKSANGGYEIPFPPALEVLAQVNLNSDMSEEVATRQLRTRSPELLLETYKAMAEIAENVGAHALLLVQPRVRHETNEWSDEASVQISAALEAGLDVLDIRYRIQRFHHWRRFGLLPGIHTQTYKGTSCLPTRFWKSWNPQSMPTISTKCKRKKHD